MTKDQLRHNLEMDLWYSGEGDRWRLIFVFTRRPLFYQRILRHAEYWRSQPHGLVPRFWSLFFKIWLIRLGERLGIQVPPGTCGPGLSIAHAGGIVVHRDARIGPRCRLSQGVTIGASPDGTPGIGCDVFFGPNAQVIGPVRLGDGATVLPGAVVVRDVPAVCTVGGVPATVLKHGTQPWHRALLPIPDRSAS